MGTPWGTERAVARGHTLNVTGIFQNIVFWYKCLKKKKVRVYLFTVCREKEAFKRRTTLTHSGKRYMWKHLTNSRHRFIITKQMIRNRCSICNGKN